MLIFINYTEMERKDQLFNSALKSRGEALERIKQSEQSLIIVASSLFTSSVFPPFLFILLQLILTF
jgi:hypothetical protein